MLQTPERARDALPAQLPASSSPSPLSDDDTISDNSFDAGSDHFAFTPKCSAKIPRAWERQPATPFAPRTETQKIWKRVPLQDKSTNSAVEIRAPGEDDADTRGVKRVRLVAPIVGNGKENYASTQWDKQSDDAKRKIPKEQKNMLQGTRNSVSPLRKDITLEILNDPPLPTALEMEADRVIRRLEEMQKVEQVTGNDSSDEGSPDAKALDAEYFQHSPQTPTSAEDEANSACDSQAVASADGAATTPSSNGFFTDSIIFDDQDSESETDEDPVAEYATWHIQSSDSGSETSNEQAEGMVSRPDASTERSTQEKEAQDFLQAASEAPLTSFERYDLQREVTGVEDVVAAETETMAAVHLASELTHGSTEHVASVLHTYETVPDLTNTAEDLQEDLQVETESKSPLPEQVESGANVTVSESSNGQAGTPRTSEMCLTNQHVTPEVVTELQADPATIWDDAAMTNTNQADIVIFGEVSNNLSTRLFTPQAPILSAPEAPPSDDTAYLHDFLTRARAQKAARAACSPEKMDCATSSPAKNTRQAVAHLSMNPISPSKSAETELKPDEAVDYVMNDDQATSPCRRSSRPRLPKPLKSVVPAIPNTIPVRRSNGTEFVFLQRTEAMQISLDTRTNTKRNKGEAVPPSVRLESLATSELSPVKERKKSSKGKKMVKWDEKLRQEQLEAVLEDQAVKMEANPEVKPGPQTMPEEKAAEETEKSEKREKNARKSIKRLGTVNGTPAPKKRVMTATALPVPTRTLRARTRV